MVNARFLGTENVGIKVFSYLYKRNKYKKINIWINLQNIWIL